MHDITKRILAFNQDRLPETLPVKYQCMTENMFRFFRGTDHVFYEDLHRAHELPPAPLAWVCGDLHLENFGSYKSDNRLVYFDLNDFDEAILAPASMELVRMVTSILIAFDSLKIDPRKAINMAKVFLKSYSATLAGGKAYYIEPQTAKGIVCTFLTNASKKTKKYELRKQVAKDSKKRAFLVNDSKHLALDPFLKRELCHHVTQWIMYNSDGPYNYEVLDAAFRLAGTGSLGLKRYIFLLRSLKDPKKYLLMEMKQAAPSCLRPYIKTKQPSWDSEANRVTAIQCRMQNVPPALLSSTLFKNDSYIIQEMQPEKDSIDFKLISNRYRDIYRVIDDMGLLTASAQLRSSGRQGSAIADKLVAFGTSDKWHHGILSYAKGYVRTVKKDFANFSADIRQMGAPAGKTPKKIPPKASR